VRNLVQSKDDYIRNRAKVVIGKYRDSNPDKVKLIADKKKVVLNGPIDLQKGHEIAQRTCFTCHKLYGEGADVGPDLTGVGRSSIEALLANVIDPNQIIGAGYENVEVETKDGRSVSGRVVENTDSRVKILSIGPKEEVISKNDVANLRVSEMSVMPEGLEQMPDEDFRNLIWYIYSPPQDKKAVSVDEERKMLLQSQTSNQNQSNSDLESVALWNPEWKLNIPNFENSPAKYPEFAGKRNVLMTHPFSQDKPSAIERVIEVPMGKKTTLSFNVAAHEQGDWELHVVANDQVLKKEIVDKTGARWKTIQIDLTPFAGKKVNLRLENAANDWNWEFGYWNDIQITSS
jgi:putative heme-binding domain-containing protein